MGGEAVTVQGCLLWSEGHPEGSRPMKAAGVLWWNLGQQEERERELGRVKLMQWNEIYYSIFVGQYSNWKKSKNAVALECLNWVMVDGTKAINLYLLTLTAAPSLLLLLDNRALYANYKYFIQNVLYVFFHGTLRHTHVHSHTCIAHSVELHYSSAIMGCSKAV